MKTLEEIKAMRDELAEKGYQHLLETKECSCDPDSFYYGYPCPYHDKFYDFNSGFDKGFDAALELMLERERTMEMRCLKLEALEQNGVDNWDNYEDAMETFTEWVKINKGGK